MKFKNIQMGLLGALLLWCPNLSAQTKIVVDGVEFTTLDDQGKPGEAMLSKYPETGAEVYTVPSSVTDANTGKSYRVTIIGNDCFGYTKIREITVPESVDSLGSSSFFSIETLERVDLSQSSIDWIADYAFSRNAALKEVKFPKYLRFLGWNAFFECHSLTRAELPKGLKTIHSDTFKKCWNLTYVSLPEGVESIKPGAFDNCESLETVVIPSTLNFIQNKSFTNAGNFTDNRRLTFVFHSATPPNVVADDFNTYDNAGFPNKMRAIVPMGCTADYASHPYWQFFTWQDVGYRREIIEEETYGDLVYRVTNAQDKQVEVVRMTDPQAASVKIPAAMTSAKGDRYAVTGIAKHAFQKAPNLASVDFSESVVKSVGEFAFGYLEKLESVEFPATTTDIAFGIFNSCFHLKSVKLSENLLSIPSGIFANCHELKVVNIPAGVKRIESAAFQTCVNLESLQLPDGLETIEGYAFNECKALRHLDLPATVKEIYQGAFEASGLQEVDLSQLNLTMMDEQIFRNCPALESVTFNPNLTSISASAFAGCTALKMIELPATINAIGIYAFAHCSALHTVRIGAMTPPAMTTDFTNVFPATAALRVPMAAKKAYAQDAYWSGFAELLGEKTQNGLVFVTLNGSNDEAQVLRLADQGMVDVTVPDQLTSVKGGTFKVTVIADNAFKDCLNIKNLYLPASIRAMGKGALTNTEGLCLHLFTSAPKAMGATFEEVCGTSRPAVSVPAGSGAAYQADAFWQGFEVREGWNRPSFVLNDAEPYVQQLYSVLEGVNVDYTRHFGHTKWQALFVPFNMEYADWCDQFEVARINNIHQNDFNEDGVYEETLLEILVMGEGASLEPGVPYLIRAKQTGDLTLSVSDKNLTAPEEMRTLDCASLTTRYVFNGTYAPISGEEMMAQQRYAMADGALMLAASADASLGAYRWSMMTENRDPEAALQPKTILLSVIRDGETTGVESMELSSAPMWPADVYDLQGRRVKANADNLSGLTKGVYVVNGNKIMKH